MKPVDLDARRAAKQRQARGGRAGRPRSKRSRHRRAADSRRIVLFSYADGQSLDLIGPLEVFETASRLLAFRNRGLAREPAYAIEIVAPERGPVRMSSGVQIVADRSLGEVRGAIDTLMVAGGLGTRKAAENPAVLRFVRRGAKNARRLASVCTGTFILAEAGLLDGRTVTTHWMGCETLAASYPRLSVEPDRIFVKDGAVYTSAGVTAGMDLALALVEEDHGRELALEVARNMVIFLKRPGGQSQFSAQLSGQLAERESLRELQTYIVDNPAADLSVEALARRSAMSPRNFARVFANEVGSTPARYVERARVESARRHLEESREGIEIIAERCGFGSPETMRRAFLRNIHVGPAEYRSRFRSALTIEEPEHARGA